MSEYDLGILCMGMAMAVNAHVDASLALPHTEPCRLSILTDEALHVSRCESRHAADLEGVGQHHKITPLSGH